MSQAVTRWAAALCAAILIASIDLQAVERPLLSSHRSLANPCTGIAGGNLELAVSRAGFMASDPDSSSVEFRTVLGIQQWPEDSIAATSDSLVCTHLDSLIAVWHATAAGSASGVLRNSYWGPTAVVRINPGKYYVWPGLVDDEGFEFNFVVDSVGGDVRFWRSR
jgi:hypothetical protein